MKIFISWSGSKSRAAALALHDWLPLVIQGVDPWVSARDIESGELWRPRIAEELSTTEFGVICVTQSNQGAPWLMFEAGGLAKLIGARVVPYLLDLEVSDIRQGPLTDFMARKANDPEETYALVEAINGAQAKPQ